jgi:hypothetical protein
VIKRRRPMTKRARKLLIVLAGVISVWASTVFAAPLMEEVLFKEVCESLEREFGSIDCRFIKRPEVIYTRLVGIAGPYAGIYIRGEDRVFIQWPPWDEMNVLRTIQHEFAHYIIITEEILAWDASVCDHEALVRKHIGQPWGEKEKSRYGCSTESDGYRIRGVL